MGLTKLDHVNVRTANLEAMERFYSDALGLSTGWRPPFDFDGRWLYCGEAPIVHLVAVESHQETVAPRVEHFALAGREPRFGLRTHLVVRDSESEAWDAASELLSEAHPDVLAQRAAAVRSTAMVGAAAQARRVEDDRLGERLWNGISRVRVNLGTAIVGTPEQAAAELTAYWRMGFDEFILSAYPHLEEAERIARDVVPLVRAQQTLRA